MLIFVARSERWRMNLMTRKQKRLWIFNPDCELAIANGSKYYMPPANIVHMCEDLAFLLAYMGNAKDWVCVKDLPDEEFRTSVCQPLGLEIRAVTESEIEYGVELKGEPWGWSPNMCHWLAVRGLGKEWKTEQKEEYSRKIAREGLIRLQGILPDVDLDSIPQICYSVEEINQKMGQGKYLVKAPWSSSGKGILVLENQVSGKEKEWLSGILKRQGYVMLEKRLNKVQDFAMEFRSGTKGVEFIGWSAFTTGDSGEYRGNYIGPQKNIEKLLSDKIGQEELDRLKSVLPEVLSGLLPSYHGYLGVDMMIYTNEYGQYKLQPCVEINLRYNMGIVALFLSTYYLGEGVEGEFTIRFYAARDKALQEHFRLKEEAPAEYKNNRILSGYLNLTPITETTHFVASITCY